MDMIYKADLDIEAKGLHLKETRISIEKEGLVYGQGRIDYADVAYIRPKNHRIYITLFNGHTAEISMLEFDEQIETLGEMMTTVLPHGSDSAMFLIGLPKFVWLDEEAFPFISHVAVGEKVTGFFERRQEQEREDTVRIVCIATLKEEELAESMEPLNSIPRILPMERDLNRPPMESWSASPHAHITEFEGSWAERRMDRNRRGSWRIRS